ncbi:MAG: GNAT family N-acetyltransferase [Bacteroidales bacterium]|nr:GNAT family N-acetyltransferase [Bacteroidales bacterium]
MEQQLFLTEPLPGYRQGFQDLVRDYIEYREAIYINLYRPALKDFQQYIRKLGQHRDGKELPYHEVPYSTYWLADEDGNIYGNLRIRYESLPVYGNVGYDIRPSFRGRGLGTLMLSLGLQRARDLKLERLKITCDEKNTASVRIIEKNGGKFLERTYDRRTRLYVRRFLIEL